MDIEGYQAYLDEKYLWQNSFYDIPVLTELEQALDIDLDEYIPRGSDYSRVDALRAMLPVEMQRDYPLECALNRYAGYQFGASDPDDETASHWNQFPICGDYFQCSGTEDDLLNSLSRFMDISDAKRFFSRLLDDRQKLGADECAAEMLTLPHRGSKRMGFLCVQSNYNVNLKALTVTALALLLDIKLTVGFVSGTLAILGFNQRAIVRLDVSEGEKCLILEAMAHQNREIREDVFSKNHSECVHNDLDCNYRNNDQCTIHRENIKAVLDGLCEKNVFQKRGGSYKYNF
jgi:hypothetical protein